VVSFDHLLTPRPASRLLLWCVALLLAFLAHTWIRSDDAIQSVFVGGAVVFPTFIGLLWLFRREGDSALEVVDAGSEEFARLRGAARVLRQRSIHRIVYIFALWIIFLVPSGIAFAEGFVWRDAIYFAAFSVSEAVYSLWIAYAWHQQASNERDRVMQRAIRKAEIEKLRADLLSGHSVEVAEKNPEIELAGSLQTSSRHQPGA
jgi:hypothetical protein